MNKMKTMMMAAVAAMTIGGVAQAAQTKKHPTVQTATDPIHAAINIERGNAAQLSKDQFADVKTVSSEPTKFRVSIPFRPGSVSSGEAFYGRPMWSYANGTLSFYWPIDNGQLLVSGVDISKPGYVASNGFGATRHIEVDYTRLDHINFKEHSGSRHDNLKVELQTSGTEAKLLTQNVVAVVEGTMSSFDDGKVVKCSTKVLMPSLDFLQEVHTDDCTAAVAITRISFQNATTGEVLWSEEH